MNYEELSDDVEFAAPAKAPAKTNLEIRANITNVESALTEFEKVSAGLEALAERYPVDLVYDVTTGKGMVEAVAHRAAWREPRLAVERIRRQAKAPVLALGKDIDGRAAWLTEQLLLGEKPIDQLIKAEEARKEAIKQARINAEIARTMQIQEAIAEINMVAMAAAGKPSAVIAEAITELTATIPGEEVFQEMLPQALAARTATLAKLDVAHKAALHTEAEAARLAAERAELAQLRAAAAAQREKDAAAARIEQERVAAEQAERQRTLEAQQAELAAERAIAAKALADQQAEIERQRAEIEAIRVPQPAGEPPAPIPPAPAPALDSLVAQNNAARASIASTAPVVRTTPAAEINWINTAMVGQALGLPVGAGLLECLGFPGTKRTGPGLWFDDSKLEAMQAALHTHMTKALAAHRAREAVAA